MVHPNNPITHNPIAGRHRRSVGVFPNRQAAEHALYELRDSGFPMDRVSVVTRDAEQDDIAGADVRDRIGNKADEGATIGALSGGALGGLTGLLVGLGTLAIPGIGPIMLAGATATTLATTLAGGAIGAVSGGLLGALIGLGIPEERARVYHDRISRGGYLVIVDGSDDEIARAETILHRRGIEDYGVYDAPTSSTVHSGVGRHSAVGFFPRLEDAEEAVTELRSIGFPLSQISLVAHNFKRRDRFDGIDLHDRFEAMRLGIPVEQARLYNDRLGRGEYMVVVHGTEDELNRAAPILNRRGIQDWRIYDVSQAESSTVHPVGAGIHGSSTPFGRHSAVGFFPRLEDAEEAVNELRSIGFPLHQISLVAHNFKRRDRFDGIDLHDRFEAMRLGIPVEQARLYNDRLGRGEYMVIVHGTEDELNRAAPILNRRGIQDWRIYDPTEVRGTTPVTETPMVDTAAPVAPMMGMHHPSAVAPSMGTGDRIHTAHKRAIGVFSHRTDAEAALTELRDSSFPMERVSVIAKDTHHHDQIAGVDLQSRADNKADEGAKAGAATGGVLGGLGGLLVGLGTLAIPGVGPIVLGGAAATALATAVSGGAIGAVAGGLAGALVGLGIPEDRAKVYNDRLVKGDYLVMVDGTEDEVRRAETILRRRGIEEWGMYDASEVNTTHRTPSSTDPLTERQIDRDIDVVHSDHPSSVDPSRPIVEIVDRRDETLR